MNTKISMKYLFRWIALLIIIIIINSTLSSQGFTRIGGAISTTPTDSRSVNIIDVNNDGWEDVFISNGLRGGQEDYLYINQGDGTFKVDDKSPISSILYTSVGASFADVDNDGYVDGVITSWYGDPDLFYLNNGEGVFMLKSDSGINPASFGETAAFGDYDNDGRIDLYITSSGGDGKNFLYRNLGNGEFKLQPNHPLVSDKKPSRCANWIDADGNGLIDLYITNENDQVNDLYLNRGNGNFEKYGKGGLVAERVSSMTSSWGDIDNDGDLDVFVGNADGYQESKNQLFINEGGEFIEVEGDPVTEFKGCTFGSSWIDYDNDGYLDLFITNGFCNSNLRNRLFRNNGDGSFRDRSSDLSLNPNVCSYGHAWGDLNNDGFLDLVVANCKNSQGEQEQINLHMQNKGNENNWLKVSLQGIMSNRSAIGARIFAKAHINGESTWQLREISSQSGYAGQNSLIAHFGMGDAEQIDSIRIEWPSGKKIWLNNIQPNQQLEVVEDQSNSSTGWVPSPDIKIIPNPVDSNGSLKITLDPEFKNSDEWNLNLLTLEGRSLWSSSFVPIGRFETEVPLEQLNIKSGMYFISIFDNKRRFTRKLIIQD